MKQPPSQFNQTWTCPDCGHEQRFADAMKYPANLGSMSPTTITLKCKACGEQFESQLDEN